MLRNRADCDVEADRTCGGECGEIEAVELVKLRAQEAPLQARAADGKADRGDAQALEEDQAEHVTA